MPISEKSARWPGPAAPLAASTVAPGPNASPREVWKVFSLRAALFHGRPGRPRASGGFLAGHLRREISLGHSNSDAGRESAVAARTDCGGPVSCRA